MEVFMLDHCDNISTLVQDDHYKTLVRIFWLPKNGKYFLEKTQGDYLLLNNPLWAKINRSRKSYNVNRPLELAIHSIGVSWIGPECRA